MINGFVVKKLSMTSIFNDAGNRLPGTLCSYPDLTVTQVNHPVVQVAFGHKKHLHQSVSGLLKKLKLKISPRHFKEFALSPDSQIKVGDLVTIDTVFKPGDPVTVVGISKGRGFAGVIKRHGFHRQPVTGGQSDRTRAPGSIGAQTPGKVVKGKKMPGHYGNSRVTLSGLKVLSIDPDKKQVLISGSIPGHYNSWVTLKKINH